MKTRAEYAMEALKAAMPSDTMENIGLHEAYRSALEDMVEWIGRDDGPSVNPKV